MLLKATKKGTIGDTITWIIDYYGTLTISGTGKVDVTSYSPPWQEYNDLIKAVVVEEGITEIENTTFYDASNLKTVSLPSTLTSIAPIIALTVIIHTLCILNILFSHFSAICSILFSINLYHPFLQ